MALPPNVKYILSLIFGFGFIYFIGFMVFTTEEGTGLAKIVGFFILLAIGFTLIDKPKIKTYWNPFDDYYQGK